MRLIPQLRPRYVLGRRIHHGALGVLACAVGAALIWDDWADRWWWPARKGNA